MPSATWHGHLLSVLSSTTWKGKNERLAIDSRSPVAVDRLLHTSRSLAFRWPRVQLSCSHMALPHGRFLCALFDLADQGISTEATARIIGCLSQQRLGTRTWRAPTRVMPGE